jgi:hypothetical protein
MKKVMLFAAAFLLLGSLPGLADQSLQELYNQADGQGIYDRYIELNPDLEYIGDLRIMSGHSVCVMGNGAKIFGQGNNLIQVGVFGSRLDIQNCVMIGGLGGVYFSTGASGTIKNNTITCCAEAGIRTYTIGSANNVDVYDNIITDCYYGFFCNETEHPSYLGYNTIFNTISHRYAEFCPG